jgi:hypothetical protein
MFVEENEELLGVDFTHWSGLQKSSLEDAR